MISVAIVDNEEKELLYLQSLLSKYEKSTGESFHISLFKSGLLFLEQARVRQFELIFLDVDMPEMDGLETARKFRSIEELRSAPVEEIAAVPSMNMKAAVSVKDYLNDEDTDKGEKK